ncbi:hypothetical protein HMPREF9616_02117 [Cutibacterium acnes HL007PA1]|nr:hypothetical protein HMPREF9616_02117 [Cutibacterium acnes HL007PA1]
MQSRNSLSGSERTRRRGDLSHLGRAPPRPQLGSLVEVASP